MVEVFRRRSTRLRFQAGFAFSRIFLFLVLFGFCPLLKAANTTNAPYFATPFQDEAQFVVQSVITDVAEMVYYAQNHRLPDAAIFSVQASEQPGSPNRAPVYDVVVTLEKGRAPVKFELPIKDMIWGPETYDGLADALATAIGLKKQPTASAQDDTALLDHLTDGLATTLERNDADISQQLMSNFNNPLLHAKAAVLLGAFALREASGDFYDVRSPLCRLTAHLVVARQLSGHAAYEVNGRMAEIMLLTLMNNQKAALAKIKQWAKPRDVIATWLGVLKTRNTHDFRILDDKDDTTLLEETTWLRAYAEHVNLDMAYDTLGQETWERTPDFCRIASSFNFSVDMGHLLLEMNIPMELNEINEIYALALEKPLNEDELNKDLNAMPERCFNTTLPKRVTVRVIGWGQWAAFFQRHLCHAIQSNYSFVNEKLAAPEDANDYREKAAFLFGDLRLYAFIRRFMAGDRETYLKALSDAQMVVNKTPQLVSGKLWNELAGRTSSATVDPAVLNSHTIEWHKHYPLPGTAYEVGPRWWQASLMVQSDARTQLEQLHDTAPYDVGICYALLQRSFPTERATFEEAKPIFGPILEFSPLIMTSLARKLEDQPDAYEKLLLKAAEIDPSRYLMLGDYFAAVRQDDKAADYLEKGIDKTLDQVQAANHAPWLVRYYLRKGEAQKAEELADDAANTEAAAGFRAKAEFLELTQRYEEAFEYYKRIQERYNTMEELAGFCVRYRNRSGDTRYDKEVSEMMQTTFPKGVEEAAFEDFQGLPEDGVIIRRASDSAALAGLKNGDIIVAISSVRVHNLSQYKTARNFTLGDERELIVFREGSYRIIKTRVITYRVSPSFYSYRRK